ncbi:hypothetical protein TAL182_PE00285 (plasmid) [Rhizobium sp. TAL182]|nr:hypothetical protein TAL182_PE00285 [Rhizobium sp. TAL182]
MRRALCGYFPYALMADHPSPIMTAQLDTIGFSNQPRQLRHLIIGHLQNAMFRHQRMVLLLLKRHASRQRNDMKM